jgi:hypothetical protein
VIRDQRDLTHYASAQTPRNPKEPDCFLQESSMIQTPARLIVQRGPNPNETFELTKDKLTIGRSPGNDITITDPEISRKHIQLVRQGDGYAAEDLGSTNGSFVNNRRIVGLTPLHNGDVIELGEAVSLVYVQETPEEAKTLVGGGFIISEADTVAEEGPSPLYTPAAEAPPVYEARSDQPPPVYGPPAYGPPAYAEPPARGASCRQQIFIGCGGLLLLTFLCMATIYFLDAYDQGRLLYCGPLRPFWELILGPFGFAPPCG